MILWGPGEVGGAVLRAAHASGRFEIVGVKVFSPHKHGKDAGELVGIGPIGVRATRSRAEILALDADCAIVTPQPRAVLEGLDADVIDLLESGKSVVSTAAYHDVAMSSWFHRARSPTARLREIARTRGAAARRWERWALAVVRAVTSVGALDPVTDLVLRPVADRRIPARASAARLLAACQKGHSALHGTGVHPTFMVERQLTRMCQSLSRISHIQFAESGDFALAPEGMWGGLSFFGFGRDPRELGPDWVVARAGDFYYGDMIGNVAHALYGAHPDEVRIERALRGIPANRDLQIGATRIDAGTTAALHMVHRGYLRDHHFFTNEECWYLGAENAFHGDGVPLGQLPAHGGYAFAITGEPSVRGEMAFPVVRPGETHPITTASVRALLDAVEPVCRLAPGIVIDDARTHHRHVAGALARRSARQLPYRVVVLAQGELGEAVWNAARGDSRFAVSAAATANELLGGDADCAVVAADATAPVADVEALLLALLASGKRVVSTADDTLPAARLREACARGGAAIHRISVHATWMIARTVMTMVQAVRAVHHIRVVEAIDLSRTAARRRAAAALGFGCELPGIDAAPALATGNLADVIATVGYALYGASEVRIDRSCRRIAAARPITLEGEPVVAPGTIAAIGTIHRGLIADRVFFTSEQWRHLGAAHAALDAPLPDADLRGPTSYAVHVEAEPADLEARWELAAADGVDPVSVACTAMVLDAIAAVCAAEPGVLVEDASPRYQHDDRVAPVAPSQGR